jgi:hypothetical protein
LNSPDVNITLKDMVTDKFIEESFTADEKASPQQLEMADPEMKAAQLQQERVYLDEADVRPSREV